MQTMSFIAMVPTYNLEHKCYSKQHPTSKSRQIYAWHQDFQEFFFLLKALGEVLLKFHWQMERSLCFLVLGPGFA